MTVQLLAARPGGSAVLGREVRSELDVVDLVHGGLPLQVVDVVLESKVLELDELYSLVLSRGALSHRRKGHRLLSREQSDRITRVVRTFVRAEEALGSHGRASRWMRGENRALRGRRPIDLLKSDAGTHMINACSAG